MYASKIIADSINRWGCRAVSSENIFPRYILAEINTHRAFARNSASSRAIPIKKMLQMVKETPFVPIVWLKDHKGMQGFEEVTDTDELQYLKRDWLFACNSAIESVERLIRKGITKQLCNRLLEPFMWHKAVISATEWENFFAQRAETQAERHLQILAFMMLEEMNASTPKQLKDHEWHIPYDEHIDTAENAELMAQIMLPEMKAGTNADPLKLIQLAKVKVSTGKCANTSYTVVGEDGKVLNIKQLADITDNKLIPQGHYSPLEHPMKSMNEWEWFNNYRTIVIPVSEVADYSRKWPTTHYQAIAEKNGLVSIIEYGWCGHVRGYIPYRKMMSGENRTDSRLLKKAYTF